VDEIKARLKVFLTTNATVSWEKWQEQFQYIVSKDEALPYF
jgi:hypothetical protein